MNSIKIILVVMYLAVLAFGIFLTDIFRLPAPLLFGLPLVFCWSASPQPFRYWKEVCILITGMFLYEVVGMSSLNSFFAKSISIVVCALYFNYFVDHYESRFRLSVWVFYGLLFVSAVVMVLNHFYPQMDQLRSLLIDDVVLQSPAGISQTQFSFGYQLAALVPFALISTFVFKLPLPVKVFVFLTCVLFVFLGMQRSVFVGFSLSIAVFLLFFYRFKAVYLLGMMVCFCMGVYELGGAELFNGTDNILNKEEHNVDADNRSALTGENIRIYMEYPYGLIFYGKDWQDVIYRDYVFSRGITSHNAYLMFITYLGPFLGAGLLAGIYLPLWKAGWQILHAVNLPDYRLTVCLVFSFICVSVNAMSHNPWLFGADGPTIFAYFAVLHGACLRQSREEPTDTTKELAYAQR